MICWKILDARIYKASSNYPFPNLYINYPYLLACLIASSFQMVSTNYCKSDKQNISPIFGMNQSIV